jgi:hypothetical protein
VHIRLDAGSPRPNASELEWLTSLPRVGTPSIVSPREHSLPMNSVAPVAPSLSPAPHAQHDASLPESPPRTRGEEIEDLRAEVQNQRQTIAVLVSEKMTLGGSPERLSDISTSTSCHFRGA